MPWVNDWLTQHSRDEAARFGGPPNRVDNVAMPKRIKLREAWYVPPEIKVCPLCGREIPPAQRDDHHLVPKAKGGRLTQHMHRICHRQIHALFTESELANTYNTVEALLGHPQIKKFVTWVKNKPIGFIERTRTSHLKR